MEKIPTKDSAEQLIARLQLEELWNDFVIGVVRQDDGSKRRAFVESFPLTSHIFENVKAARAAEMSAESYPTAAELRTVLQAAGEGIDEGELRAELDRAFTAAHHQHLERIIQTEDPSVRQVLSAHRDDSDN